MHLIIGTILRFLLKSMLRKILKQIKLTFSNYPKRHFYYLTVGILFIVFLSLFSNQELDSTVSKEDLLTEISIDKLLPKDENFIERNFTQVKQSEIKRNDSLFSILKRLGVKEENIVSLVNSNNSNLLAQIKIGKKLEVEINELNEVVSLNYIKDFKSGVRAKKQVDGYKIEEYELQTEKFKVFKKITITNSLYIDGLKRGLPDSVIMDLVYIFGWDIDFVHDIRPGDSYSLIYEEVFVNGEKKLNGDILIAEFINRQTEYVAIRYKLKNGISEYFSPEGRNVKKAFLRSPVKFSYISSKYNLNRRHPILHQIRAHTGVDYVASKGTPVRATGDGTVVYADKKGGYGNLIEIKHTEDYSTRYAHLDRFHPKTKIGKKIKQSDTIGFVGKTGTATGDHLHYEFRVNGKHANPLTVRLPNARPINASDKKSYDLHAKKILSDLKNYQHLSFNI